MSFASLLLISGLIEGAYRIFDPFPYISPSEINFVESRISKNDRKNFATQHDSVLGWSGIPNAIQDFITINSRSVIQNNRQGYRDVERGQSERPAIVVLGDSFGWGFEVDAEKSSVGLLRKKLSSHEIYNLSYLGYGTDQELLSFKKWDERARVDWVVLLFFVNDFENNAFPEAYGRPKPAFVAKEGGFELINQPVPFIDTSSPTKKIENTDIFTKLKRLLLRSHFIHDVWFRLNLRNDAAGSDASGINRQSIEVTAYLLNEIKKESQRRGAKFLVVAVPSKQEMLKHAAYQPYQPILMDICQEYGIQCLDLAPFLKKSFLRTYFRYGAHWNERGHQIVAKALHEAITESSSV